MSNAGCLQGTWPGLASFYARYAARHRFPALRRDWMNAARLPEQKPGNRSREKQCPQIPHKPAKYTAARGKGISTSISNPDAEHRFIRTWRNALRIREVNYQQSRTGMATKNGAEGTGGGSPHDSIPVH